MTLSYKHIRLEYNHVEYNAWINIAQYYRQSLRANAIHSPSLVPFSAFSANSHLNKVPFKARYMAQLIGKFIYNVLRFQRISAHFLKIIRHISKLKKLKKSFAVKIYNKKNELIFFNRVKHILFFFKLKCRNRIKKQRYFLWKHFYQIPQSFWSNSKKRKIKSFIWRLFNIKGKYRSKNLKNKSRLYFMSYNRISRIIYKLLSKKRFPKKEWFILKKKKKKKNKITTKIINKLWIKIRINSAKKKIPINNIMGNLNIKSEIRPAHLSSIISHLNPYSNEINFSSFFINYCYFQYFRSLHKKNKWKNISQSFLNLFYYYLSTIYKSKKKGSDIKTSILKKPIHFSKLSHNSFFVQLNGWFGNFNMDRNLNLFFVVNQIFSICKKRCIPISVFYYNRNISSLHSIFFLFQKKKEKNKINYLYSRFQRKYVIAKKTDAIIKTNTVTEQIHYFKHLHKSKSWTRLCYYPRLFNYKRKIQWGKKDHPTNHLIKINNLIRHRKYFFFTLLKHQLKKKMIESILTRHLNSVDAFNSSYIKNKKNKYYYYNTKHRKLKYIKKRAKLKLPNFVYKVSHQFAKNDQFLLNYFLYIYIQRKLKPKRSGIFKKYTSHSTIINNVGTNKNTSIGNNNIYKRKHKKILSRVKKSNFLFYSKLNVLKKNKKKKNLKITIWKYYNLTSIYSNTYLFDQINKYQPLQNNVITYKKMIPIKYKKKQYKHIKKPTVNLLISNNSYNYYLKYERQTYLTTLWENRKSLHLIYNKITRKNETELRTRFYFKSKFVYKFYNINTVEKELLNEYYTRMHSNQPMDEYERNFSRVGPLSFYHTKTQNIGTINGGTYMVTNILFYSNFYYPKPFFTLNSYYTSMLLVSFFIPFKQFYNIVAINQFSNTSIDRRNYLLYKQFFIEG